jgi:hypothetical protein
MAEDGIQEPLPAAEVVVDHGVVHLGLGGQAAVAHLVPVVLGKEPRPASMSLALVMFSPTVCCMCPSPWCS